jgi:beta-phosphoglucomutase-like phosphatase (HAD superfamily)
MAIEAVIFDCDGTLVDSVPVAAEVLVEYLADLGVRLSVADKETDSEALRVGLKERLRAQCVPTCRAETAPDRATPCAA